MIPLQQIEDNCFKEPNSGCWLWEKGAGNGLDSYGRVWDKDERKLRKAHRAAWQAVYGEIPEGAQVCHKCDTPLCCRPDHLFLGNDQINRTDMANKGRSTFGARSASSKLTNKQALEIFNDPRPYKTISEAYNISIPTICGIKTGHHWAKITGAQYHADGGKRRRKSTIMLRKEKAGGQIPTSGRT